MIYCTILVYIQINGGSYGYTEKTQFMTMTALLTAIAILIPIIMPFKIVIHRLPTLGSHIPIFIAMFLSPLMAAFVIIASSLGFLMAGYPPVIVLRAFSHIVFGTLGLCT